VLIIEQSRVVFGMPKEAIAGGAVDEIAPLERLAERVLGALRTEDKRRRFYDR
jgi:two-component system chemotaxis response regulator CheB